jgi:hypothetical protein
MFQNMQEEQSSLDSVGICCWNINLLQGLFSSTISFIASGRHYLNFCCVAVTTDGGDVAVCILWVMTLRHLATVPILSLSNLWS